MRTHETDGISVWFEKDLPDGLTLMACGHCNKTFTSAEDKELIYHCKGCGNELCYRPWYEW
jgi:hypothetical protein